MTLPGEAAHELPGVFAGVLPAFMPLAADTGQGGAVDPVAADEGLDGEGAAPEGIGKGFRAVPGDAPEWIFPLLLFVEADGKGIFHRTAKANAVIKFSHVIEPCPGYLFSVSQKPFDGDLREAFIVLRPNEALMLSCVIEHIFASIIFGV